LTIAAVILRAQSEAAKAAALAPDRLDGVEGNLRPTEVVVA